MPELPTKVAEQFPEPLEGRTYTITGVEMFTSKVQSYKGLRVTMVDDPGNMVVAPLWLRDEAGQRSKLGAFITALGANTDNWINKKIKFLSWRPKDREIQVVQ